MRLRRTALRSGVQRALIIALGERGARVAYDAVSASRELAWNSLRRRLYPAFWRRALADRTRKVRSVAIHGELGDAILALPFLYGEHRRHPDEGLEVVIKGLGSRAAASTKEDPFAERGLRRMRDGAGRTVSFLAEFWLRVPFVDEVHEGDINDPRFYYWQPQPAFTLQRRSLGPSDYAPFLDRLFTQEDCRRAGEVWGRTSRPLRLVAHLRRSADEIVALLQQLDASALAPACAVAVVGSRRHEPIPDVPFSQIELIDLTDNYEQGIAIMPLLQTVRMADLFLGGRGGFELFALAARVPALTVFDEDGWWEQRRLWPKRLWDENPLGAFFRAGQFDARTAFEDAVRAPLERRLALRRDAGALGVAS